VDVEAGVSGRSIGAVAGDVEARLEKLSFPLEYHAEVLTQTTAKEIGTTRMLAFGIGCAVAIFLLLQAAFNSWTLAGLTFVTLPLALTGGLVAAFANGGTISLGALAGFLTILGIATRNAIVQIKTYQRLAQETGEPVSPALVMQGARERLAPIVATALATGLALAPLAVIGPVAGNEILHPMAVVILGGLVTATLVNLLVIPSLYLRFVPATQAETEDAPWTAGPAVSPVSN
jgi:Cu/Ag efflux pump CusA